MGAYLALAYCAQPAFLSITNLGSLVYYLCLVVSVLIGVNLLMALGLFDLSVGAVAALSGIVLAFCNREGLPLALSIVLGLFAGVFCGTVNWALVSVTKVPALVSTLITMLAARSAALIICAGQTIEGLPIGFKSLTTRSKEIMSPIIILGLFLIVVMTLLNRHHFLVRRMYLTGNNREAAVNAGINVTLLEWIAFGLAALGAATVGILQCSRTLSASPLNFPDLALECIAACVIGGARITGGSGSPVGASIGMLVVIAAKNLVILVGINPFWREFGMAMVLLTVALLNRPKKRQSGRT